MAKDPVDIDELDNDPPEHVERFGKAEAVPDERHQFDQADTDEMVEELTKMIAGWKKVKPDPRIKSLFDGIDDMPPESESKPEHYRENPNKFYTPKGRLWND